MVSWLSWAKFWLLWGDLKSFVRNGHVFLLKARGFGAFGSLVLLMDGVELPKVGMKDP